MNLNNKLKIYIAGPDVFELDAKAIGKKYISMCADYGFIGLYPLDNEIKVDNPHNMAEDIYYANKKMIDSCDIVIANLIPFRGKEPDAGTVWELGYAVALGKQVYAYMSDTKSYLCRFKADEMSSFNEFTLDNDKRIIEDFELPVNLMIACSVKIIKGDFEDVLKVISHH